MIDRSLVRKAAPAAAAFSIALVGIFFLVPRDDKADEQLVPVVVATRSLSDGTTTNAVRNGAEVRMVAASARAEGALGSLDSFPDGVLAYDHVVGQQILLTSFAQSRVRSLGTGYSAISVKLDPQRWVGALIEAGRIVDVYDTDGVAPRRVATRAVILEAPDPADLLPGDDTLVSLGVPEDSLADVLVAVANNRVWLVGS